ncbi:uncharacterized protein [Prorops nasuta]|uniref:uncharacterized protein isoform X1 n=1 Tax=Prorops nasuta TaxID=863751 RepID=UPI0034CE9367
MFKCKECKINFENMKAYLSQIYYFHKSNIYSCDTSSCGRTFASYESFRKHFRKKHNALRMNDQIISENCLPSNLEKQSSAKVPRRKMDHDEFEKENTLLQNADVLLNFHETSLTSNVEKDNESASPQKLVTKKENIELETMFAAKLHSYLDIPRGRINDIIRDLENLFENLVNSIEKDVSEIISSNDIQELLINVKKCFNKSRQRFQKINSEWLCFKEFKKYNTYIEPVHYCLGERNGFRRESKNQVMSPVKVTAQFIPIRHVLKTFFELPGIFTNTFNYINTILNDKTVILNFIQGDLWQKIITQFEGKQVLPLFLYFDDYENNNPLGSHKGISKCGAVYLSIPCLPPKLISKTENIFLFILFNTLDRIVFRNNVIFSKAIDELQFLEKSGIEITIFDETIVLYFKLALVIGDNLGLHSILGFTESINSTYFCRFCCMNKIDIQTVFEESNCQIRTKSNYESDLLKSSKETGRINETCIFHRIQDFHVTQNLSVDVMHDVLEGICQYDLGSILYHFTYTDKYFKLEDVNILIKSFDYGCNKNKPPEILYSHLKKKRLIMSASEMCVLVRHFSLIFGSYIVKEHPVWQLLIQLQQLVQLLVSPHHHYNIQYILKTKITDYLRTLNSVFPNSLRPKHHFLVHYPRVFVASGPLWNLSSMRFESKNREAKISSHAAVCRINVCRTIAIKNQCHINYRFLKNETELPENYHTQTLFLTELPDFSFFQHTLSTKISNGKSVLTVKKINLNGTEICNNTIIMIPSEDGPLFYIVNTILALPNEKFLFITKLFKDVLFDYHFQAYQIYSSIFEWVSMDANDIVGFVKTHSVRLKLAMTILLKIGFNNHNIWFVFILLLYLNCVYSHNCVWLNRCEH